MMIGRNRLLLSPARLAVTSLSKPKAFNSLKLYSTSITPSIDTKYRKNGVYHQVTRSSTASTRTAFEITNEENYLEHLRNTDEFDDRIEPFGVLTYAGSRVLCMSLPITTENVTELARKQDKAVLDNEVAAAVAKQKSKNVGCNVLSLDIATRMIDRLDVYADNEAINVVFFASSSLDLFSGGLFSG